MTGHMDRKNYKNKRGWGVRKKGREREEVEVMEMCKRGERNKGRYILV